MWPFTVRLMLLQHRIDPAKMDIHGKVARTSAFERAFNEMAELLAIAASDDPQVDVDWKVDRSRREEEENGLQTSKTAVAKVRGGDGSNVSEEDSIEWTIPCREA